MIKIQEHLNRVDADIYIKTLVKAHWIELNPRLANNSMYKSNSLIEKCKKYYSETDSIVYIKKYANNSTDDSKRHKKFFLLLKKDRFKFLQKIITCKPEEFLSIQTDIYKILHPSDLYIVNGLKVKQTPFGKLLTEQFLNYKKFRSSSYCKKLYEKLDFQNASCPYCNEKEVQIVKKNKTQNIAYFDLDHFYPKSQNPFFAISFYNLIPSCKFCNSTEKGSKVFNIKSHLHPYYEAFDDFYLFQVSLNANIGKPIDLIKIEPKTQITFGNISDFNLLNRYEKRLNEVDILVKYFLNNYKKCKSDYELELFKDFFIKGKKVPLKKNLILNTNCGKLFRDILIDLDKEKILGIIS